MSENIFILGAGASKESGAPLMNNFLDVAEDLLYSDSFGDDSEMIRKVFKVISDLQSVYSKSYLDLNNIESLFGILEMAKILDMLGNYSSEQINEVREALVILIVKTLEKKITFRYKNNKLLLPQSYNSFVNLIKKLGISKSTIITFNYDLALDATLKQHEIDINYCLDPSHSGGLKLLKLHGSINWSHCLECGDILPVDINLSRNVLDSSNIVHVTASNNLNKVSHEHNNIDKVPLIVPPTWNKNQYHGTLTNVWHQAGLELATAKNIYVFGYSLPESDAFFRYLFALGTLGKSRLRRFWVFDPNTDVVEERYKKLIGRGIINRFRYFPLKFAEAISKFM